MKARHLITILFLSVSASLAKAQSSASPTTLDKAVSLYEMGIYSGAMDLLLAMPEYGSDPVIDGYATLCACKMRSRGYETMIEAYLGRHPSSFLCDMVLSEKAFDLFDKKDFERSLKTFSLISIDGLPKSILDEYYFKFGYSYFMCGDPVTASSFFANVDAMQVGDYTSPARYNLGYICYLDGKFEQAAQWMQKAQGDERFDSITNYYIINCRYQLHDYAYVLDKGVAMYYDENVPKERRAHLARIIAESYLLTGNKDKAGEFWTLSEDGSEKFRADYFFAGSLMFTTGNWQGAIDNYSHVVEKRDSLSQIAWYQMAFSYLKTRNRVAALDAFKNATDLQYDSKMTEDAFFNYAKLAFDLNGDTSVFGRYMDTYSTKVRGEKMYSYMALASLQNRDYQGAIDFYDKIDVLEGQEKNNYVHANYLRGAELMASGSYRRAAECLKAVTYYTPKNDLVNQLARYCLAETCYSDGDYAQAQSQFTELYNASALYGMRQGALLSYNAAWSAMKQQNYEQAAKLFAIYASGSDFEYKRDALLRRADCIFAMSDYEMAAQAYRDVMDKYKDVNDIYPLYQCAVATGLITKAANRTAKQKQKQKTKNTADKIALLQKVNDADPSAPYYAEALFELGKTLLADKMQAPAVAAFLKIVEKAPKGPYSAKALLEVGTVRRSNGNIEGAVKCFKQVVEQMDSLGYTDDALLALESIYQSENTPEKYLAYLDEIGRGTTKTAEDKQKMIYEAALQIFYSDNYAQALASFQNFAKTYPDSPRARECAFFIAECYRKSSDKVRACEAYRNFLDTGESQHRVDALKQYAALAFDLEEWPVALEAYKAYADEAPLPSMKAEAKAGMMRSAFRGKNYDAVVAPASELSSDSDRPAELRREASLTLAKSYLALSRRDEALAVMKSLATEPKTSEGAQAAYFVIQDCFDKAEYDNVREKVFAFSESGTSQTYWLAKAFILLGDCYAEQGDLKQAKATFQSIADGYEADDEVKADVNMRLDKLKQIM